MIPAALTRAQQPARRALNARHAHTRTPPAVKPSVHPPTGGLYIIGISVAQHSATALRRYKQCTFDSADVHFEE